MAQSKSSGTQNKQSANELESDAKKTAKKNKDSKSTANQSKTTAEKGAAKKKSKR